LLMYIPSRICISIYIYIHTCIHINIYMHMYIYTYMYIYMYKYKNVYNIQALKMLMYIPSRARACAASVSA